MAFSTLKEGFDSPWGHHKLGIEPGNSVGITSESALIDSPWATSVKIIVVANIFRKNLLMKKQILIGLGVFVALLLAAGGIITVSHSAREAIRGFSLRGQISSFADELLEAGVVGEQ